MLHKRLQLEQVTRILWKKKVVMYNLLRKSCSYQQKIFIWFEHVVIILDTGRSLIFLKINNASSIPLAIKYDWDACQALIHTILQCVLSTCHLTFKVSWISKLRFLIKYLCHFIVLLKRHHDISIDVNFLVTIDFLRTNFTSRYSTFPRELSTLHFKEKNNYIHFFNMWALTKWELSVTIL